MTCPGYLAEYDRLAAGLAGEKSPHLQRCFAKIEQIRPQASVLQRACEQGILPVRTVHGDPKVENFLFDQNGQRAISLIDLDTVGPGLLHHDLGDCLRSCCNRGERRAMPARSALTWISAGLFWLAMKPRWAGSSTEVIGNISLPRCC